MIISDFVRFLHYRLLARRLYQVAVTRKALGIRAGRIVSETSFKFFIQLTIWALRLHIQFIFMSMAIPVVSYSGDAHMGSDSDPRCISFLFFVLVSYFRVLYIVFATRAPFPVMQLSRGFLYKDDFIYERDGRSIWCSICANWKPDRAHYCREVGRCVRKMDHFCPWQAVVLQPLHWHLGRCSWSGGFAGVKSELQVYCAGLQMFEEGASVSAQGREPEHGIWQECPNGALE